MTRLKSVVVTILESVVVTMLESVIVTMWEPVVVVKFDSVGLVPAVAGGLAVSVLFTGPGSIAASASNGKIRSHETISHGIAISLKSPISPTFLSYTGYSGDLRGSFENLWRVTGGSLTLL